MNQMPLTARRALEVLGLVGVGVIIIYGSGVIMPLLMAFFIALLLLPMFRWLRRHRVPEVPAIILSLTVFMLVVVGIATFLAYQIGTFARDMDAIQQNLNAHWNNISAWINTKMHFTTDQQLGYLQKQAGKMTGNVAKMAQGAAVSLSGILIFVGLVPIYVFLIMFYRGLLLRFTFQWFVREQHHTVLAAAHETEVIVKYYLVGLLIQIAYLTILVSGILMAFGIKHAILIGITFAILNLIPYIGALIGNVIGVLLTLTSSQDISQVWIVLGTIALVQFLDNNILMPRIVGSKVKVNALASIVGIVVGGSLAGISGMFLSIPVMAALKIIFDKSDALKQWGILLGDERGEGEGEPSGLKARLQRKRDAEVSTSTQRAKARSGA